MSEHVRSRSEWKIILEDQESPQPIGPVVQPSDEQPQQVEPPTESQHIAPNQGKEDTAAPEFQGPGAEADFQELAHPKTKDKGKDGPDVQGKNIPNLLECSEIPEAEPDPEAVLQEHDQPNTGGEETDGPNVKTSNFKNTKRKIVPFVFSTSNQEKHVQAITDVKNPNQKLISPDLPQPETWDEDLDDLQFKWEISPKPEPIYMPEAGEGNPRI